MEAPESVYGPGKDKPKGLPPEIVEKMLAMDVLIAKTFNSFSGRKVLQWLKEEYVESHMAGFVVDATGAINAQASVYQMFSKEGQRVLVKNIEMRIKRAESGGKRPFKPKPGG